MAGKHIHDFETGYEPLTLRDGDSLLLDPRGELFVYADPAVTLTGGRASIRNHGVISTSNPTPIVGHLTSPFDIRIVNSGSIYGRFPPTGPAIMLTSEPGVGGVLHILNSGGTVGVSDGGGLRAGIDLSQLHADQVYLVNTGKIGSEIRSVAYDGSDGADTVRNSGTIFGDVDLDAGDDMLRDRGTIYGHILGGGGDDRIFAGNFNDSIWGGLGRDVLAGRGGGDRYDFDALADSAPDRVHADVIRGFDERSGDIIILSDIDADTLADGDQAFAFVGTAAFSGSAGELRCDLIRGGAVLYADVDGDAVSDFALVVRGNVTAAEDLQIAF